MTRRLIRVIPLLLFLSGCAASRLLVNAREAPPDAPVQTIPMTAEKYHYTPDVIRVKQGTLVRLMLTSKDVTHGFGLKSAGIDVEIPPGKTVEVEFYASQRGEQSFKCTDFCGIGHPFMGGKVIVQ